MGAFGCQCLTVELSLSLSVAPSGVSVQRVPSPREPWAQGGHGSCLACASLSQLEAGLIVSFVSFGPACGEANVKLLCPWRVGFWAEPRAPKSAVLWGFVQHPPGVRPSRGVSWALVPAPSRWLSCRGFGHWAWHRI